MDGIEDVEGEQELGQENRGMWKEVEGLGRRQSACAREGVGGGQDGEGLLRRQNLLCELEFASGAVRQIESEKRETVQDRMDGWDGMSAST